MVTYLEASDDTLDILTDLLLAVDTPYSNRLARNIIAAEPVTENDINFMTHLLTLPYFSTFAPDILPTLEDARQNFFTPLFFTE